MPDIDIITDDGGESAIALCHGCNRTHTFVSPASALVDPPKERAEAWAKKHAPVCELFLTEKYVATIPSSQEMAEVKEKLQSIEQDMFTKGYIRCNECSAWMHREDSQCMNCGVKV